MKHHYKAKEINMSYPLLWTFIANRRLFGSDGKERV